MDSPAYTYIASPYSDPNPELREARYLKVLEFTAHRLSQDEMCFSPIVHCHEMAKKFGLPPTFDFWQKYNFTMLAAASRLTIFALPGWEVSIGVQGEKAFAIGRGIPYAIFAPGDNEDQLLFAESAALDK